MEITLTLDEELVARARRCAERRQTTLDAMVAELLCREDERAAAIEAHTRRALEHGGHAGPGYRFRRADCYEPWLFE